MIHLGVILLVTLPCLLGGWIGSRSSEGGMLAGAAIGLFTTLGVAIVAALLRVALSRLGL